VLSFIPLHGESAQSGTEAVLPAPATTSTSAATSAPTAAPAAISARAVITALVVLTLGRTAFSVLLFGVEIF